MVYYIIEDECNGCTSCANICPTGAASGEKKKPHRIDEAVCIECGVCGKLCPQGAVRDPSGQVPQRLKRKQWEKPFFDKQKCVGCAMCLEVCPSDCITLGTPGTKDLTAYPEITDNNAKKCVSCGFCAQACPVDAIEMHTDDVAAEKVEQQKMKQEKSMVWTLKKSFYRVFQIVMKYAAMILPFPVPVLLIGSGSVKNLAENIKARGIKNVLVVTDKVLMDLKLLDEFLASLSEKKIQYTIFDDVQPNPTIENVEAGRIIYKQNKCKAIIAFGGGSPIDCAKIIGARIRNPYLPVRFMKGLFRVIIPIPPMFCIPTTAGTGSETTLAAVITNAATHEKFAINDLKLIPKIAVLDPELMVGLPPHITSTTGMDALTHAVEAYIGQSGSAHTDESAEYATKLIFENLEKAYNDGSDMNARNNMAIASFYAGAAFTRAYVGYVHAVAHNMGGLYGVPHGLANAVILPYVLEFCRNEAKKKIASLAVAGGLGINSDSDEILATRFIEKVKTMNKNMHIPTYIEQLKERDIPLIAKRALKEAHPLYPVPKIMTHQQCEELVRKLLPQA
ncbi:MAG: iron-containing alcohol dehydrogenase [Desulfobacteraceae bacterium]|jgi:alcohol dehydrogenase|nr:iron-containing alcohol dehydrogenase [Desulfobacteraceae bacterium]